MNKVRRREIQSGTVEVKDSSSGFPVYVGNLAKSVTREQLREFFGEDRSVLDFCFRLEDCRYCPTKVALIRFANREDQQWAFRLNQTCFQGNRVLVTDVDSEAVFTPKNSLMVKNLDDRINEEDLYKRFRPIGALECVVKPTHNYGYVSFVHPESLEGAMNLQDQFLKGVEMNIQPVRRNVSILLERPPEFGSIREKCGALGLKYRPEAESETRLLITNIPRQTAESDLLDYLGKFGKISDWVMEKSAISVMTNSAGVTYLDPKTARAVFLAGPHYFHGGCLDVYHPQLQYGGEVSSKLAVLLQRTNIFITNDEIFQEMNECGPVSYIHRVDPVRHCTIVRFRSTDAVIQALKIKQIGGENVMVTNCTERNYNTDIRPYPEMYPKSSIRLQKEETLDYLMEQEQRAERARLPTVPDESYRSPSEEYFRNEVRILNYPPGTTLPQFREFFRKHGNVINLRENRQGTRCAEAFVSFDTLLEARRACQMNQCFLGARRMVIHLASERVYVDPTMCVRVSGLKKTISDEEIYDSFCEVTIAVRFVLRESDETAVVGFDQTKWISAALTVEMVARTMVRTSRIVGREEGMSGEASQVDLTEDGGEYDGECGENYDDHYDDQYADQYEDTQVDHALEPTGGLSQRGYYEQDSMCSNESTNDVSKLGDVRSSWQVMGLRKHSMEPTDQKNPSESMNDREMQRLRSVLASRRKMEDVGYEEAPEYDESGELLGTRRRKVPVAPPVRQQAPKQQAYPTNDVYGDIGGMTGSMVGGQWGPQPLQQGPPGWNAGPPRGPMPPGSGPMRPGWNAGPMGPGGPMRPCTPDQPQITPLMRSLMQKIEAEMSYTQAFSTMPMVEQFRLVNGIINQHLNFPPFTNMAMDDKIGYLCSGANGFPASYAFGLFTYPQQQQLLSLVHADFVKNNPRPVRPIGPVPAPAPGPNITPAMRGLMQKIEAEMSSTQAFCTMPMNEQLRLVDGIIKQHSTFKKFTAMSVDDKIKHLISGANGFGCTYSFTLFTYPQQHMLLSLIHADYIKHHPDALKPEVPRTVTTIVPVETSTSPGVVAKPDPTKPSHFTKQIVPDVPRIKRAKKEFKMAPATNKLIQQIGSQLKNSAFPTLETKEKVRLVDDLVFNQKRPQFVKLSLHGKIKHLLAIKNHKWFRSLETFQLFTTAQQETMLSIIHADYLKNNVVKPYLSQNPALQEDNTDYSFQQKKKQKQKPKSRSPSPMTLPDHLNRAPATRSPSPLDDPFLPTTSTSRSRSPRSQPRSTKTTATSTVTTKPASRDLSPVSDEEFETIETTENGAEAGEPSQKKEPSPVEAAAASDSERFSISPEPVEMTNCKPRPDTEFDERTVFVYNLPMSTIRDDLTNIFGRFGKIVAQDFQSDSSVLMMRTNLKRAQITYDTAKQAQRAIDEMHLRRFRTELLTVRLANMIYWPRPGYSVKVKVLQGGFSMLAVYDTFRMCGAITQVWLRFTKKKKDCLHVVIDFKHRDAVQAALEIRKINIGWPCEVTLVK